MVWRMLLLFGVAVAFALLAGISPISLDDDSGLGKLDAKGSSPTPSHSHDGHDRIRKESRDALRDLLRETDPDGDS